MTFVQFVQQLAARGFWFNVGHWFVIIATLILGILAYKRNPRNLNNRRFLFLNISFGTWTFAMYASDFVFLPYKPLLFLFRATWSVGFLVCLAHLNFCLTFPEQNKNRPRYYWIVVSILLTFMLVAQTTELLIKNPSLEQLRAMDLSHNAIAGPLFYFTILIYFLFTVGGLAILFSKLKKLKTKKRTQVQYVFLGLLLFVIFIFATDLIPQILGFTDLTRYGGLGVIFIIGFSSYAVIRHRLMDIRLVLLKSVAYSVTLISLATFFIFFVYYLKNYYQRYINPDVVFVITAFIAAFGFQPLRRFVDKAADNFFFRPSYNFDEVLGKVSQVLSHNVVAKDLISELLDTLLLQIRLSSGLFSLSDNSLTVNKSSKAKTKDIGYLCQLVKNKKSVTSDEIEDEQEPSRLKALSLEVIIKIPDEEECFGILALGQKKSGEPYTLRDLRLLEIIAPQITVAIKNAKRREEMVEKVIEERQRIQQDAHDRIYNRLGVLAKTAELASHKTKDSKEEFSKIEVNLRQTISDFQRIVSGKDLVSDSHKTFLAELKQICKNHEQNYNQRVSCHFEKDISFLNGQEDSKLSWNLQCILQECLNNAGKYSKAKKIDVRLCNNDGCLVLAVKDDGKGLGKVNLKKLPKGHLGLKGILNRAKELKGTVDISSSNAKGTEIKVKVPL